MYFTFYVYLRVFACVCAFLICEHFSLCFAEFCSLFILTSVRFLLNSVCTLDLVLFLFVAQQARTAGGRVAISRLRVSFSECSEEEQLFMFRDDDE